MNIPKQELVFKTALACDMETREVALVVDAFMIQIKKEVAKGNDVELRGFGSFRVGRRKAKKGQDFKRGKTIEIPAKDVVKFFPGLYFRVDRLITHKVREKQLVND